MQYKATILAALVASVSALQVTQPASQSSIDVTKENTIEWTTVSTDPSTFSIYLVNENVNPSVSILIKASVDSSAGSYKFGPLSGVTAGADYQIDFDSTSSTDTGILAQSGQFTIVSSGSSTTSVSFSSSTPSTSMASTSASTTLTSTASTASTTGSSSTSGASAASNSSSSTSSGSSSSSTSGSSASSTSSSTAANASSTIASSTGGAAALHIASGASAMGLVALVAALFA